MGKIVVSLLKVAAVAAGYALGGPAGAAVVTAGLTLLASGGGKKPDTQVRAKKTPRPVRVSAYGRSRLYGASILYETASDGTAIDHYAIHSGEADGIEVRYLNDDIVTVAGGLVTAAGSTSGGVYQAHDDGRYLGGNIGWHETDGSIPGSAGTWPATTLAPGLWGANHRGDGAVLIGLYCAAVAAKKFQEIYPQSTPPEPSIVARWQKCPDPAAGDPLDEGAWTWTENPVRQLLHYKIVHEGPRPSGGVSDIGYPAALAALRAAWWARKIAPTLDYWIAAAAVCDSTRALAAGGTEPLYRSAVAHEYTSTHKDTVGALLATFDGWLAPRADGAYVIYAGEYYAPTVSITPADIVAYTWEGGPPDDDEALNELRCSYLSNRHDYQYVEGEPWRDETDIAARGRVLSDSPEIQTPSFPQTRYLAKRMLQRRNATGRGSVTATKAGRAVIGERFINLRLEEAGAVFYDGPAEILSLTRLQNGGVSFTWVAADENIDAWNPATEEGEPAAAGDRVAGEAVAAPVIDTLTAMLDPAGARLTIEATGPDRSDLTWYGHWREVGASVWGPDEVYSDADPGSAVTLVSAVVPVDIDVEAQVAYRQGDGRFSPWSAAENVSTSTAGLAPGPPTGVVAADGTGSSNLTWTNPTSANFSFSRTFRNTVNDLATATQYGADRVGAAGATQSAASGTLAAGTYYFFVRAYNASGTPSVAGSDSAVVS